jgi:hypothetical protein
VCWLISSKHRVFSVVYSPDGTKIAITSKDKTLKIWNAQTGSVCIDPDRRLRPLRCEKYFVFTRRRHDYSWVWKRKDSSVGHCNFCSNAIVERSLRVPGLRLLQAHTWRPSVSAFRVLNPSTVQVAILYYYGLHPYFIKDCSNTIPVFLLRTAPIIRIPVLLLIKDFAVLTSLSRRREHDWGWIWASFEKKWGKMLRDERCVKR